MQITRMRMPAWTSRISPLPVLTMQRSGFVQDVLPWLIGVPLSLIIIGVFSL